VLSGVNVVAVVPAYDEAPRIERVLRSMPEEVDRVLVVDDASTDGTARVAAAFGDPRVEVLAHRKNRGVGAAIATGYRRAIDLTENARDTFVVMAGDGQMDPADIGALVEPIASGTADYVKGNRFRHPSLRGSMPLARRVGGQLFSWLTAAAIAQPISDSQCGYTAISRAACVAIDLDGLWPGYGYPNDLLGQLAARRLRIAERTVRPVYVDEISRLRLKHLPRIGALIARAWIRRVRA
jgi:glycosyltransferase involved in cell wall biosynthesis